jgi:hypothetical protein
LTPDRACVIHTDMDSVPDTVEKMQSLSPERAARVVSLIDDLAELEAREAAEDLAAAQQSLAEYQKTGEAVSLDDLEERLAE